MDDTKGKLAALQGIRSGARRARNPNAPDRDSLMISIGMGKPVTTPEEDAAISSLGDPSVRGPLAEAGGDASSMADELMGDTDISSLGQVSPALHEAGTGATEEVEEDEEEPPPSKRAGGSLFDSYRRSLGETMRLRELGSGRQRK